MRPDLKTPDTLQIMLYVESDRALCIAAYRADSNEASTLPMQAPGKPWAALAAILGQTRGMAQHVLVVCNRPEIVDMLMPVRFHENRMLETEPDAHWQVNTILCTRYPSRCAAMHAERMPKTEAAWQSHYSKTNN